MEPGNPWTWYCYLQRRLWHNLLRMERKFFWLSKCVVRNEFMPAIRFSFAIFPRHNHLMRRMPVNIIYNLHVHVIPINKVWFWAQNEQLSFPCNVPLPSPISISMTHSRVSAQPRLKLLDPSQRCESCLLCPQQQDRTRRWKMKERVQSLRYISQKYYFFVDTWCWCFLITLFK